MPWWPLAIGATFWLASLVNLVLLAENRLASPTGDGVTPLRLGLLAQFLLIVGWALTRVGDSLGRPPWQSGTCLPSAPCTWPSCRFLR